MKEFVKQEFDLSFPKELDKLAKAEKVTKEVLRDLSRTVLHAHHQTQDVAYVNKLIAVLTPVNRKVAILYFTEFTGFREEGGQFTKKDKVKYEAAHEAAITFLEDPNNNIWSWAEREVDITPKEFDIKDVTKATERMLKKAGDAGVAQADVLRAMFKAGFDVEALLTVMTEMDLVKADAKA